MKKSYLKNRKEIKANTYKYLKVNEKEQNIDNYSPINTINEYLIDKGNIKNEHNNNSSSNEENESIIFNNIDFDNEIKYTNSNSILNNNILIDVLSSKKSNWQSTKSMMIKDIIICLILITSGIINSSFFTLIYLIFGISYLFLFSKIKNPKNKKKYIKYFVIFILIIIFIKFIFILCLLLISKDDKTHKNIILDSLNIFYRLNYYNFYYTFVNELFLVISLIIIKLIIKDNVILVIEEETNDKNNNYNNNNESNKKETNKVYYKLIATSNKHLNKNLDNDVSRLEYSMKELTNFNKLKEDIKSLTINNNDNELNNLINNNKFDLIKYNILEKYFNNIRKNIGKKLLPYSYILNILIIAIVSIECSYYSLIILIVNYIEVLTSKLYLKILLYYILQFIIIVDMVVFSLINICVFKNLIVNSTTYKSLFIQFGLLKTEDNYYELCPSTLLSISLLVILNYIFKIYRSEKVKLKIDLNYIEKDSNNNLFNMQDNKCDKINNYITNEELINEDINITKNNNSISIINNIKNSFNKYNSDEEDNVLSNNLSLNNKSISLTINDPTNKNNIINIDCMNSKLSINKLDNIYKRCSFTPNKSLKNNKKFLIKENENFKHSRSICIANNNNFKKLSKINTNSVSINTNNLSKISVNKSSNKKFFCNNSNMIYNNKHIKQNNTSDNTSKTLIEKVRYYFDKITIDVLSKYLFKIYEKFVFFIKSDNLILNFNRFYIIYFIIKFETYYSFIVLIWLFYSFNLSFISTILKNYKYNECKHINKKSIIICYTMNLFPILLFMIVYIIANIHGLISPIINLKESSKILYNLGYIKENKFNYFIDIISFNILLLLTIRLINIINYKESKEFDNYTANKNIFNKEISHKISINTIKENYFDSESVNDKNLINNSVEYIEDFKNITFWLFINVYFNLHIDKITILFMYFTAFQNVNIIHLRKNFKLI